MAFNDDIAAIRKAQYGRDVREAIASGLERCYDAEANFNQAYNAAIVQFETRLSEAIASSVNQATETATASATQTINTAKTNGVSAVNTARDNAVQRLDDYLSTHSITLSELGLVYSATEPSNKKTGMIWLKPVGA